MRMTKLNLYNILADSAPVTLLNLSGVCIDTVVILLEDGANICSAFKSREFLSQLQEFVSANFEIY